MTQTIRVKTLLRTSTNGTTMQDLYTVPTEGAVIKGLLVTSADAAVKVMQLWVRADGVTDTLLGSVSIPANSGNNGSAVTVDFFTGGTTANQLLAALPRDQSGKPVLPLEGDDIIKISTTAAAAGNIYVTALIEEF
jgi:hypothetical protein